MCRALIPAIPDQLSDLECMLSDHGVEVDHTTLFRWIQAHAPEIEKRTRRRCPAVISH